MIIKSIKLRNFRNYSEVDLDFSTNLNYIFGSNGSGKTNLVEAIYYFSFARSFREKNDLNLIKENEKEMYLEATFEDENTKNSKTIKISITNRNKIIHINNDRIRKISQLNDLVDVIVFSPKDSFLFKETPQIRRNFINESISKVDKNYFNNLIKYNKLLKERNNLLKNDYVDEIYLNTLDEMLAKCSFEIFKVRTKFFKEINQILARINNFIGTKEYNFETKYYPIVENYENYTKKLLEMYKNSRELDFKYKTTSVGVHKEDFSMVLNNKHIAIFGSQGENRIAVLLLKISLYFVKRETKPIIILDDVLSELDEINIKTLLNKLETFTQVFITSTGYENYEFLNKYYVSDGKIRRN